MSSMRHGAHRRFIDLRPFPVAGPGRLGLDLRPGQRRAPTLPDTAVSRAPLHPRAARHGGDRSAAANAQGAPRRPHRGGSPRGRLLDADPRADHDEPRQLRLDHRLVPPLPPLVRPPPPPPPPSPPTPPLPPPPP